MKNRLRYLLGALPIVIFHVTLFSMLAPVTRAQKREALGHYYRLFRDAPTKENKIFILLLASKDHQENTEKYRIIQQMLFEKGFHPGDVDAQNNLILQRFKQEYKKQLEDMNFNTVEQKVNFLKSHMESEEERRANEAGPEEKKEHLPFQSLLNEALQSLINELYKDEV